MTKNYTLLVNNIVYGIVARNNFEDHAVEMKPTLSVSWNLIVNIRDLLRVILNQIRFENEDQINALTICLWAGVRLTKQPTKN